MESKLTTNLGEKDNFIVFVNSQGVEGRATLLRLTRYLAVFEVYNPYSILQMSEVLGEFRIIVNDKMIYSGRGIVSNLVNTGVIVVCEATLDESWLDVDLFSPVNRKEKLREEFAGFFTEWKKILSVRAAYKVVVSDVHNFFIDLRRWLDQVELGIRTSPHGNRVEMEKEIIAELRHSILPALDERFGEFEAVSQSVDVELQPLHRSFVKRQLHPHVLCSPFAYRTYRKPLGYAGDYEMVNMILRDPHEGSTLFAKVLNVWLLDQPSAKAHRNRVLFLERTLGEETERRVRLGRQARILNLGCGPAKELQLFVEHSELSNHARVRLLDFNDETLLHTRVILESLITRHKRSTFLEVERKSVHQLLKEAARHVKPALEEHRDFIYCAGLFDYLNDRTCKRVMNYLYEFLAPGGLLLATNVDSSNPNRHCMSYILEWHLFYRSQKDFALIKPDAALDSEFSVETDDTRVNIFIKVRKPDVA